MLLRKCFCTDSKTSLTDGRPYVPNGHHGLPYTGTRTPMPTIPSEAASAQQTPRVNLPGNTDGKLDGGVSLDGDDIKTRPASVLSARSSQASKGDAKADQK